MYTTQKLDVQIALEKSFEGEYRATVKLPDWPTTNIEMPWVIGQDLALRQLGKLFTSRSAEVLDALKNDRKLTPQFIRQALADTRR